MQEKPKTQPEFMNLIPPLTPKEYGDLEQDILTYGCRNPICLWDGVIVDGHSRYDICVKHGMAFGIKEIPFATKEDAKLWRMNEHMGQRNLTDTQRMDMALKKEAILRTIAKKKLIQAGKEKNKESRNNKENELLPLSTKANEADVFVENKKPVNTNKILGKFRDQR